MYLQVYVYQSTWTKHKLLNNISSSSWHCIWRFIHLSYYFVQLLYICKSSWCMYQDLNTNDNPNMQIHVFFLRWTVHTFFSPLFFMRPSMAVCAYNGAALAVRQSTVHTIIQLILFRIISFLYKGILGHICERYWKLASQLIKCVHNDLIPYLYVFLGSYLSKIFLFGHLGLCMDLSCSLRLLLLYLNHSSVGIHSKNKYEMIIVWMLFEPYRNKNISVTIATGVVISMAVVI